MVTRNRSCACRCKSTTKAPTPHSHKAHVRGVAQVFWQTSAQDKWRAGDRGRGARTISGLQIARMVGLVWPHTGTWLSYPESRLDIADMQANW